MQLRNDTYWEFIPQKRVFFFFWKDIGKMTSSYTEAEEIINRNSRKIRRL